MLAFVSRLKWARVPTWSTCAWVMRRSLISSGLNPNFRIDASMSGADGGIAPSIRMWPAGVVIRYEPRVGRSHIMDRSHDSDRLRGLVPRGRVRGELRILGIRRRARARERGARHDAAGECQFHRRDSSCAWAAARAGGSTPSRSPRRGRGSLGSRAPRRGSRSSDPWRATSRDSWDRGSRAGSSRRPSPWPPCGR